MYQFPQQVVISLLGQHDLIDSCQVGFWQNVKPNGYRFNRVSLFIGLPSDVLLVNGLIDHHCYDQSDKLVLRFGYAAFVGIICCCMILWPCTKSEIQSWREMQRSAYTKCQ